MGEDCIYPMMFKFYSETVAMVFWSSWPNKMHCVKRGCYQSVFSPLHVISVWASYRPTDHLENAVSNLSKSLQNLNNLLYWHIYSQVPIVTWHLYSHQTHMLTCLMSTRFSLLLLSSLPCHVWGLAPYQSRWTWANDHSLMKLEPSHYILFTCHVRCLA